MTKDTSMHMSQVMTNTQPPGKVRTKVKELRADIWCQFVKKKAILIDRINMIGEEGLSIHAMDKLMSKLGKPEEEV